MRPRDLLAGCLLLLLAPTVQADAKAPAFKNAKLSQNTLGVSAGSPGETDFTAATEIAAVLSEGQETGPHGETAFRVSPLVTSNGSRVEDVLNAPDADLGIAPRLFLDRARQANPSSDLRRKLVIVTPLFTEELHVVVAPRIGSIQDLAGQVVDVGPSGGVSEIAARDLFAAAGVHVQETHRDAKTAVEALRRGEVAGVVLLSGKPVAALADLTSDEAHLLPAPATNLPEGYLPAQIRREDYPKLLPPDGSVPAAALGSVLFAYRWPRGRAEYAAMEAFTIALFSRLADLQAAPRHPKWREMNVAALTPGWDRFGPSARWLQRRSAMGGPALQREFDRYLARSGLRPGTSEERAHLFEDYLRTRNHTPR